MATTQPRPNGGRQPGLIISDTPGVKPTPPTVPPSVTAEAVLNFQDARDPDLMIDLMSRTLDNTRSAAERAVSARTALLGDVNHTEPSRHRMIREAVTRTMAQALENIDKRAAAAEEEIAKIEQAISCPAYNFHVTDNFIALAVVNRLAALKPAERNAALTQALDKGDDRTLAIVLSSPAFVCGLSEGMLKARYGMKRHAGQMKRVERLKKAVAAMQRARASAESFRDSLFNARLADEAERAAMATQAALQQE